jgi:ubiquinone/menaquinone biosynthesis C-methylase UbiE
MYGYTVEKTILEHTLEHYYSNGKEKERLDTHCLEKDRSLRILRKLLPAPPAVVVDIGGAAGAYAFPLAALGYQVHLIDPIPLHIEQAKEHAKKSSVSLASYAVGDARALNSEEGFADAILLFGPLYHLMTAEERQKALAESFRVLKPGGILFAVAISRFASLMDAMNKTTVAAKIHKLGEELSTGLHWKTAAPDLKAPYLYFHEPSEFHAELIEAGFKDVVLKAIEGPVWQDELVAKLSEDSPSWDKLLSLLETIEEEPSLMGASAHIMGIGKKDT